VLFQDSNCCVYAYYVYSVDLSSIPYVVLLHFGWI